MVERLPVIKMFAREKESVRNGQDSGRKLAARVWITYSLIGLLMTWPAARYLGSRVPGLMGKQSDAWIHLWTFWWVKKAILEGLNPFYTHLLYHPTGVSLTSHNIAWVNIALWLPLQALVGEIAAYSLVVLAIYVFNAFSMYLLAREWRCSVRAAFVAGLIFGFWPYTLSQSEHPNLIFVGWVPLALLFLQRAFRQGRSRDFVWAGVMIALIGLTRWQLLIVAGFILGPFLLYQLLFRGRVRYWPQLLLSGSVALLLMLPLLAPVVYAQMTREYPEELLIDQTESSQVDLLAYLVPGRYHPLWGKLVASLEPQYLSETRRVAYVGTMTLALAVYGTIKRWRQSRFWLIVALLLICMAAGPVLRWAGDTYPGVPMPYRLIEDTFFMQLLRNPHRFNVLLPLPLGLLAGLGLDALLKRNHSQRRVSLRTGIVTVLILFDYCVIPFQTLLPQTPAWYEELAAEKGDFAILEIPLEPRGQDKWSMIFQMTHGKPLVGGHVSRIPGDTYEYLDSSSFLKKLRKQKRLPIQLPDVSRQLEVLAAENVRYITLHKKYLSESDLQVWRDWLMYSPAFEDRDLLVFRTQPAYGRDFEFGREIGSGIGLIHFVLEPAQVVAGQRLELELGWASRTAPMKDYQLCLGLSSFGEIEKDQLLVGSLMGATNALPEEPIRIGGANLACVPISQDWPPLQWGSNAIVRERYSLLVDQSVPAGFHTLLLAISGANGETESEMVDMGPVHVTALPATFRRVDASWEIGCDLVGYDLGETDESIQLDLYWCTSKPIQESLKVFMHLIDAKSGQLVAQQDQIPAEWSRPTSTWVMGEVVVDRYEFLKTDLEPSTYQLQVGLYREDSGERLPISTRDGQVCSDRSLILCSVNVEGN